MRNYPLISVCMITYNHEKYVSRAVESVLMQNTKFPFELVIADDASNDKTRGILKMFKKKYPDRIRLILREKNIGMGRNFLDAILSCKGDYLAILEGDDFWVSGKKLETQAGFLEKYHDYALCFCRTQAFFQKPLKGKSYFIPDKSVPVNALGVEELLKHNFIATCSVMYRKKVLRNIPDWFLSQGLFDWSLHLLYAGEGKIGYIDQCMSKYRIHKGSYFSSKPVLDNYRHILRLYTQFNAYFQGKYSGLIRDMKRKIHFLKAQIFLRKKDRLNFWISVLAAVYFNPVKTLRDDEMQIMILRSLNIR